MPLLFIIIEGISRVLPLQKERQKPSESSLSPKPIRRALKASRLEHAGKSSEQSAFSTVSSEGSPQNKAPRNKHTKLYWTRKEKASFLEKTTTHESVTKGLFSQLGLSQMRKERMTRQYPATHLQILCKSLCLFLF